MKEKSQKDWFKAMYNLGEERPGWSLEVDPQIKKSLDELIGKQVKEGRVLDLGCGQGRHALYCAELGLESYGVDYVERAIKDAQDKAREKQLPNANFKVGDILDLNLPENYFDIVIDSSVLDHIEYTNWKQYMDNLLKVLKVGGFVILSEFSAKDERINKEKQLYEHDEKPYPESLYYKNQDHYDHYFHDSEIKKIFSENFEVLNIFHAEIPVICNPPKRLMLNALLKRVK
jgi:ubiquinone/menaquinone biosynthesis C-methylase UbiE